MDDTLETFVPLTFRRRGARRVTDGSAQTCPGAQSVAGRQMRR